MIKAIGTIAILILFAMAPHDPASVASQAQTGSQPVPDDPTATDVDRLFIRRAYEIARNAISHGNEPFGAILVRNGKILAEFEHAVQTSGDVTKHAETGLISDVCMKLNRTNFRGSTLYSSTEPCTMCCGAIRWAGIDRVVFGVSESQVDRIFEAHFGDPASTNALRSKEVLRRIAPRTTTIGPVAEGEGLSTHAEFWPKFVSRAKKEGARKVSAEEVRFGNLSYKDQVGFTGISLVNRSGTMSLFAESEDDLPPQAQRLSPKLHQLAEKGIYIGTSSWKYEGWLGSIYSEQHYLTRGKYSKKKFEESCLTEYARTFPTVCGDFAFYQFPTAEYWERLFRQTPRDFVFGFKVPEDITVSTWPKHARYGQRAGRENEHFLDATVFTQYFAKRLEPYHDQVGPLIFEFGTFNKSTFPTASDFMAKLDPFLAALPKGFRYGIELRNPEYLSPEYFGLLGSHNVAHVFNAWTRMPSLIDQVHLPEAFTADFTVVRACYGRAPSTRMLFRISSRTARSRRRMKVRAGMKEIVDQSLTRKKPAFLFVNNRLEGNAPGTIEAVVDRLVR